MISEPDETAWEPPTGPAGADPDPTDGREHESAPTSSPVDPSPVVTPLEGDPPVAGRPWTVKAQTAAGVNGLVIEIEGRAHDVTMRPDPRAANAPPTWSGTIEGVGTDPLRYRFVWRSNWNGDVTGWQAVIPSDRSPGEPARS